MPKYLILYRSATSAEDRMAAASAEEQKAGMDAWMQWKNKVEAADVKFEFAADGGDVAFCSSATAGYILISMSTPAGRFRFMRASTVLGVGSVISMSRL
jgi:hypothetical protein